MSECSNSNAIVAVGGANGPLGNNLVSLIKGLYFAAALNMSCLYLDPHEHQNPLHNGAILDLPTHVPVDKCAFATAAGCQGVLSAYRDAHGAHGGFWTNGCHGASAGIVHRLAKQYLEPHLKPAFWRCLTNTSKASRARANQLLTIHLRGGDLLPHKHTLDAPVNHWMWRQPPCAMYQKIIESANYTDILVLVGQPVDEFGIVETRTKHPCIDWVQVYGAKAGLRVVVQSRSVLEDACALYQAQNVALSYSTFGESLAVLSGAARRLYYYNRFQEHTAINCKLWPGAKLYAFFGQGNDGGYTNNAAGLSKRMITYSNFTGPHYVTEESCVTNKEGDWVVQMQA